MTVAPLLGPAEITALYLRISEADDELGVSRQRKDMGAKAESLGLPVVNFCDNDFSASRYARRKRPRYQEMLRLIEEGRIRHVVFWDLSRLTRQPKELEHLIDLADAGAVEVHSMTGRIDLRDPDGRAMARVVGAMNAKASDDTSKRIKRQQVQARVERRSYHGGGRPFGFEAEAPKDARGKCKDGALPAVFDPEAQLLREAARRVLAGDGLSTVARDWNRRGLPSPTGLTECLRALFGHEVATVPLWRPRTIKEALLRDLTVGAGIITAEAQQELRAILTDPTRRMSWSNSRTYLLSAIVLCGECGAKMRAQKRANGKPAYTCDAMGCRRVSSLGGPLDRYVTEAVVEFLSGPALVDALKRDAEEDDSADELIAELEALDGRLAALEAEYVDGEVDLATWKRMSASFKARVAETRRVLADRSRNRVVAEIPTAIADWWPTASLDQRRAVITACTESITLGPGRRGIKHFESERVSIVWKV